VNAKIRGKYLMPYKKADEKIKIDFGVYRSYQFDIVSENP
jgi:hypothetical protein